MTFDVTAPSCSVSDLRPEAGNAEEAEKIKLTCGFNKELPTDLREVFIMPSHCFTIKDCLCYMGTAPKHSE